MVREKSAPWLRPARMESDEKLDVLAPARKLVRTWPAGTLRTAPEATKVRLPVSDFDWPLSSGRSVSRVAGIGPLGVTTSVPAVIADCRAVALRSASFSLRLSEWS
jgi:hypothetical protein